MSKKTADYIACQGEAGAFSHLAAKEVFPDREISFYATFDAALEAVLRKGAEFAVLPVENSAAGRVTDMHRLLGDLPLYVAGEHFLRIRHCLLGIKTASLEDVQIVRSHPQALSQCRSFLKGLKVKTEAAGNTAMAAKEIAALNRKDMAVIASKEAAGFYGLKVLKTDVEDFDSNVTRFWILSRSPALNVDVKKAITSFVFWVENKPAVLYKCLGGFATNGIDLLRLESYVDPKGFLTSAGFLVDVAAYEKSETFQNALKELLFFAQRVKILGTYTAAPYRLEMKKAYES